MLLLTGPVAFFGLSATPGHASVVTPDEVFLAVCAQLVVLMSAVAASVKRYATLDRALIFSFKASSRAFSERLFEYF